MPLPRKNAHLCVVFGLQHLTTAVHAALQVDVVRAMQFAGIRVFDISRLPEGMMAATLAALHLGKFTSGDRHGVLPWFVAPDRSPV